MAYNLFVATEDPFSSFPAQFRAGAQRLTQWYVRLPRLFAVHGPVPPSLAASVAFVLDDGQVTVCHGEPELHLSTTALDTMTPVYALAPNGAPAVPTGRVFVRFADHVRIEDRRDALRKAGYVVTQTLPYAPHAAWVMPAEGRIADSLAGLAALQTLPDMMNVEPQLLKRRLPR